MNFALNQDLDLKARILMNAKFCPVSVPTDNVSTLWAPIVAFVIEAFGKYFTVFSFGAEKNFYFDLYHFYTFFIYSKIAVFISELTQAKVESDA